MFKYSIFKTPLGFMGVVLSLKGIHMVILPMQEESDVKKELSRHYTEELVRADDELKGIIDRFKRYINGNKVEFKADLDVGGITPFELKVYDAVRNIPYGETRSYSWVAKEIIKYEGKTGRQDKKGKQEVKSKVVGERAVGKALKNNRLPIIIPCHRVIYKSGVLGGFSRGVAQKLKLLKLEGRIL